MTRFNEVTRINKIIVVMISIYIITLMSVLMFLSKDISPQVLIGGFGALTGILSSIIGFLKYQNRKKKRK